MLFNVNIKTLPFIHLSNPLYSVFHWPSRQRQVKYKFIYACIILMPELLRINFGPTF